MPKRYHAVAVNGSPKAGIGNTSRMTAMIREHLEGEGFGFEEIFLNQHHIEYCTGCGFCLDKGACWIRDDYRALSRRVMAADALVLASPVYFFSVTAQMKTFLDRSLTLGHKPRGTWKPGLAVSVSAGSGETGVGAYLGHVMRAYGAFPVGALTAIAVAPGQFLGKAAVQRRAADLAGDLARAVREGIRYPATDLDLRFWQFMSHLVKDHREMMRSDHEHWDRLGLYDRFESYVGQKWEPFEQDLAARDMWVRGMIREQRTKRGDSGEPAAGPQFSSAREVLSLIPEGLDSEAARDVHAVFQFEVSGNETFTSHIRLADGNAVYVDGPAEAPDVVIHTPADVWLAISSGTLNGPKAFMDGKFRVTGNLDLLMKMDALFVRKR